MEKISQNENFRESFNKLSKKDKNKIIGIEND